MSLPKPANNSSFRQRSNKWRVVFVLVLILASVVGGLFYQHRQKQAAAAMAAAENLKPNERTQVHALGRLEPAGTILELSPKSGNEGAIIEQLLVSEGEDVVAGATLAVLDNQSRRLAALEEAKARLQGAEAQLRLIKAGAKIGDIEAQEAALKVAETQAALAARDLDRALALQKQQAISKELIDQRRSELDRLQQEEKRAGGMLASLREVREVDIDVAKADVLAAQSAVLRAEADADASIVKAPFDGRVLKVHTRPGEKISERGILELGNVRQMQAVAEVFEADVAILRVGMEAEIRIDSSDVVMQGRVIEIGNLVARKVVLTNDPVSDTDARVVEVRIDLDNESRASVTRLSNARVEVTIFLNSDEAQTLKSTEAKVRTVSGPRSP
jgi:HlyD family secretion protein